MTKYRRLKNGEVTIIDPEKEYARFACCDCGMVHTFGFKIEGKNEIGMAMWNEKRSTAQLRNSEYGSLHKGNGKWKLIRAQK